jgi:hypothetical protein
MGGNGGVPAASNANALTDRGFGIELAIFDLPCDGEYGLCYRLFCHNGTTYSIAPSFVRVNDGTNFNGSIGVVSNGAGTISAFFGENLNRPTTPAFQGTLTGGPTTTGPNTLNWLDAAVVNSSAATSSTLLNFNITDMKIIAG